LSCLIMPRLTTGCSCPSCIYSKCSRHTTSLSPSGALLQRSLPTSPHQSR
jgi:hypothetical protein